MTKTVLITRPEPQADALAKACHKLGMETIILPMLMIEAIEHPSIKPVIANWQTFDKVIFVSPNAVHYALAHKLALPKASIISIGTGTSLALEAANWPVDLQPSGQFNSESLLDMPALQDIQGERIAIICGEGGRDLIETTLQQRGATVDKMICYRSFAPEYKSIPSLQAVTDVVITSAAALTNFTAFLNEHNLLAVQSRRLIVSSERLQRIAKKAGFVHLILAKNASIDAIITTLNGISDDGTIKSEPRT